ncbi:MAG: flagellar filament capping protein FliD [Clostridium sp.]|nr:flagellar filament capping protein FliD [Clostridium sp.]
MAMRLTGMYSGLDTESIIQELVAARQTKVDDKVKEQKKLKIKQDTWSDLNKKLKSLQSKVSNMRLSEAYTKRTTKVSNSSIANVITGDGAMNGVQELEVQELAKIGYMTGGKVGKAGSTALTSLGALGLTKDSELKINVGGKETAIKVGTGSTISDVLSQLKKAGVNANFDENQQRIFISSKDYGKDNDFSISGDVELLNALGLNTDASLPDEKRATKVDGQDAKIILNGATFTSKNNVFEINGLTITALSESKGEKVTLTTEMDTDGIYDMIKSFLTQYNEVMKEMDTLYNASSAKGYEPLTNEEKASMTDTEIEEWEKKIKDSILRRDENLSTVSSTLREVMSSGITVGGKTLYLFDFGIDTLGYFDAEENERNMYHIDGDADDVNTSGNADKLKSMIANDPDTVISFFSQLSQNLYGKMFDMSKSVTGYRSYGNFYDDKKMQSDYDDYTSKIKEMEDKLTAYEDKWYAKFSKMETAMAKMQSSQNALSGLLGG